MSRHWHLMHGDGSEWTRDELVEVIQDERRHDDQWPYDAELFAVTLDQEGSTVYLLDNCEVWHMLTESDDMAVVWDEPLGWDMQVTW